MLYPSFFINNNNINTNTRKFEDLNVTEKELVTFDVEGGKITEGGIRTNVSIALQYLNQWFKVLYKLSIFVINRYFSI